jgi:HSP20 family protein
MAEMVKRPNGLGGQEQTARTRSVTPPADIRETGEELVVELDLPGVKAEDVDVHFDRGELTIRAKGPGFPTAARSWLALEYQPGDYERSFRLSPELDVSRVSAELKNGVLTLRLPKADAAKLRRIAVKGE